MCLEKSWGSDSSIWDFKAYPYAEGIEYFVKAPYTIASLIRNGLRSFFKWSWFGLLWKFCI